MTAVETHNLTKIYENRHIAINGLDIELEPGSVVGLLGPNGAGKTTFLRLILGLHRPSAGWIRVFGKRMTPNAAALRCRLGYLPTGPRFPPQMTPITYLDFVGKLFGLPLQTRKPRLASLIRAVDLLGVSSQRIVGLSTGMLTRLGIAASLMNEPEMLIWDEPTYGLDPEARRQVIELMKQLAAERTLVLSSHVLQDVDEVCDHAVVLNQGQLIFQGTMAELKGRMRRNQFELQLEGKAKAIETLRANLAKLQVVRSVSGTGTRIELELAEGKDVSAPLAEVFMSVSESGLTLVSVRTKGQQTEEAFLELVESDQARGFARATDHQAA